MAHLYDLIIIGSGPAGLGAAIYAQRARLDTLVIEKAMVSGGQVLTTYEVDNYPGLPGISGYDLGLKLREHADKLGVGWIQTFQNDRIRNQGYVLPGGFQAEARIGYYGFEIYNTIYAGDNIMPYYYSTDMAGVMYGDNLYTGSIFYSTSSGVYNRLEISYHYDFRDFLRLRVASVHHYDRGRGWGWQQLIQLTVDLNNFQFPSRPRHHR